MKDQVHCPPDYSNHMARSDTILVIHYTMSSKISWHIFAQLYQHDYELNE